MSWSSRLQLDAEFVPQLAAVLHLCDLLLLTCRKWHSDESGLISSCLAWVMISHVHLTWQVTRDAFSDYLKLLRSVLEQAASGYARQSAGALSGSRTAGDAFATHCLPNGVFL